jgi:hypothetical protein
MNMIELLLVEKLILRFLLNGVLTNKKEIEATAAIAAIIKK